MSKRFFRYHYLRFKRLKGDPQTLARGVAIGVFIGITPTIPLHTVLILLFSFLFSGNALAGILAATVVSNPLTFFLQYYSCWWLGSLIFPDILTWQRMKELLATPQNPSGFMESLAVLTELGLDTILVLLTGGLVLALPFTIVSYIYTYRFFNTIRRRHRARP